MVNLNSQKVIKETTQKTMITLNQPKETVGPAIS